MTDAGAPAPGSRVVLRYRLPAGSSPSMTDVVGELLSLEPVSVRDARGRVVRVPVDNVVALKAVAARTVARADIRALECAAVDGWPGLEQEWIDGWLLRAGGGHTRRANSAVPLDNPSQSAETLQRIARWYERRLLPPQLVLPDRLATAPRGWRKHNETVVMVADIANLVLPEGQSLVQVHPAPAAPWLSAYAAETPVELLTSVRDGIAGFAALGEPQPMAIGRVAVTLAPDGRRWAGLTAVRVAAEHRRRGLASLLCGELLRWSTVHGATHAYAAAAAGNEAASRLYHELGFTEHHRYWYVTP